MRSFLALVGMMAIAAPLAAQATGGGVQIHGSFRSRMETWSWVDGAADGGYVFSGNILKLNFSQTRPGWDWQVELAAPFLLGMPSAAVAPAPQLQLGLGGNYSGANDRRNNDGMLFAKQGWVRWKGLFGDKRQSLKLGRFEFNDGLEVLPKNATLAALKRTRVSQRLLGVFGWSHVGRSYDGFHYSVDAGKHNVTVVGAMPTRGAFQVDGWGNLKTGVGYAAYNRQAGGGKNAGELRLLGMYYDDWRNVLKTDNRPAAARRADMGDIRIGAFGGHYLHAWETAAGTFDLMLWGVGQAGNWGVQNHRAWATDFEAGWQPLGCAAKPWLRAGHTYTSGDDNPNDGTHGTFMQMLPTPRPYAKTPFYNMMNIEDSYGTLTLRPHKAVTVVAETHILRLANRADLWYQGGGAFQPWSFGFIGRTSNGERRLANLYDAGVDWTVNTTVSLSGYWGFTDGRAVMKRIYPKGENGQFGYVELNLKW